MSLPCFFDTAQQNKKKNHFLLDLAQLGKAKHNTFHRARKNCSNINIHYLQKRIFQGPILTETWLLF